MRIFQISRLCIVSIILCFQSLYLSAQTNVYNIKIDLAKKKGSFKPIWAFFGYDESNYTYMKDGRKLLSELSQLSPVPVYVRCHNMLTSGDGTPHLKWGSTNAYTEDANGNPVYNWRITDSIFDTYIRRGMKPIAEIGFMPEALSTNPQPYEHHWAPDVTYNKIFTGWAYPPKDYNKWRELVYKWVKHCEERYGESEVKTWWWEVWNEPDIGYWQGTKEEYFKLYDFAADAVKKACPGAKVGGPTTTSPRNEKAYSFLSDFLKHCDEGINYATGKKGSPLDYVSFHANGCPKLVNGIVRMNMAVQLTDIYRGFEAVKSFSKFRDLPVIIGECDPEGCAACSVNYSPQNAYRNGTMYSSYTAASYARIYDIAGRLGVNIEGAVSWSFEFEDQSWFAGFRDLATNGVDKPVLNVFRMFGKMRGERVEVVNDQAFTLDQLIKSGVHDSVADVHAFATADRQSLYVMVWNYYDDDISALAVKVNLEINSIHAGKVEIEEYSIDETNSNAYTLWKKMGSPQNVSAEQYAQLERAAKLKLVHQQKRKTKKGLLSIVTLLPRQSVKLFTVSW